MQVRDGAGGQLITSARFRDTGWYHIVVKIDTTQSTAADRFRLYVNGSETVYSSTSYASEDADIDWNNSVNHYIGRQVHNTSNLFDGLLCQNYFIDGQALGPEYFGFTDPLTNTWKPKKFTGNFYLPGSGVVYSDNGSGTVNGTRTYDKAFDGAHQHSVNHLITRQLLLILQVLPGGGITVSSSLRMYLNKAGTPAASHFTVNGTNLGGSVPSDDWLTINGVSLLETITFYHQSG